MPLAVSSTRDFDRDVKRLKKRFRRIEEDLRDLLADMRNKQYRGDLVPRWGPNVYKVRLTNRSARRGKSGGFRAVYRLLDSNSVEFLHIYSKSDKDNASPADVRRWLSDRN